MGVPSNYTLRSNPTIPVDQGLYEQSTTKKTELGTKLEIGERTFRYAKAGVTVTAGGILCAPAPVTTACATGIIPVAGAVGDVVITVTCSGAAVTTDQYIDGYIGIASGNGAGEMYRIKQHDLGTASTGTTAVKFTLYDPLVTAPTATSLSFIIPNPYNGAFMSAAATGCPVGASMITVTAGNYFWLQTKGLCNVLGAAANTGLNAVYLGTSGSVLCNLAGTSPKAEIGVVPECTGVTTVKQPIFLNLE